MARAGTDPTPYPRKARERIAADRLLKKLQKHVDGEVEMTATQLRAAEVLLKKCVPDLKQVEQVGPGGGAVKHDIQVTFK